LDKVSAELESTKGKLDKATAKGKELGDELKELRGQLSQSQKEHYAAEKAGSALLPQRNYLSDRLLSNPVMHKKHLLIAAVDTYCVFIRPFIEMRIRSIHAAKNPGTCWPDKIKNLKVKVASKDVAEEYDVGKLSGDSGPFELAKLFIPAHCRDKYDGFESLDATAIFNVLFDCKGVIPKSPRQLAHNLLNMRNTLSHAGLYEARLKLINVSFVRDWMQQLCKHAKLDFNAPELQDVVCFLNLIEQLSCNHFPPSNDVTRCVTAIKHLQSTLHSGDNVAVLLAQLGTAIDPKVHNNSNSNSNNPLVFT
jgi:hypothetical protein